MNKNKIISFLLIAILNTALLYSEEAKDSGHSLKSVDLSISADIAMSNPNYLVAAGDIYELAFMMGGQPISVKLIVDISYNVKILNLATLYVNGLTFSQFKRQVEEIVRKNYPLSGAQLVLLKPALFIVAVKGEVSSAGEVRASALTRLSSVVNGFFTQYSSNRNIKIISVSGKEKEYDLFKASRYGDFSQNPFLRPGDTIIIQRLERKVSIGGSVERAGSYQLLEGENLKELIEIYAGGFTQYADISKLTVTRNNKTDTHPLGSFIKIEDIKKIDSFILEDKDSIYIPNELEFKSHILLDAGSGLVRIPFTEGADLVSIVRTYRSSFSTLADTKNAYLMRSNEKIYTNFNRIFYDIDYNEKIYLEAGDLIVVPIFKYQVIVAGAVAKPGVYPYIPGKTYSYYIALAGGFNKEQNRFYTVKIKDAAGKKMSKNADILPDCVITASADSFVFYAMPYITLISGILGIISSTLAITFSLKNVK